MSKPKKEEDEKNMLPAHFDRNRRDFTVELDAAAEPKKEKLNAEDRYGGSGSEPRFRPLGEERSFEGMNSTGVDEGSGKTLEDVSEAESERKRNEADQTKSPPGTV